MGLSASAGRALGPLGSHFTAADSSRLRFRGRIVRNGGRLAQSHMAARENNAVLCHLRPGEVSFDWPCTSFTFKTSSPLVWLRMDGARNYFNVLLNGSCLASAADASQSSSWTEPGRVAQSTVKLGPTVQVGLDLRQLRSSMLQSHGAIHGVTSSKTCC